jgi:hypothetical protein
MVHLILLSIALVILSCFDDTVAEAGRGAIGVASPGLSAPITRETETCLPASRLLETSPSRWQRL